MPFFPHNDSFNGSSSQKYLLITHKLGVKTPNILNTVGFEFLVLIKLKIGALYTRFTLISRKWHPLLINTVS